VDASLSRGFVSREDLLRQMSVSYARVEEDGHVPTVIRTHDHSLFLLHCTLMPTSYAGLPPP
jgi:hypothetical protein